MGNRAGKVTVFVVGGAAPEHRGRFRVRWCDGTERACLWIGPCAGLSFQGDLSPFSSGVGTVAMSPT